MKEKKSDDRCGGSASQASLTGGESPNGAEGGAEASNASQNKQKTIFPEFSQIVKNP